MINGTSKLFALSLLAMLPVCNSTASAAEEGTSASSSSGPAFKKIQMTDKFYSEGCTYGDFNKDGTLDYAAGPFWYEGPEFQKRHTIYEGSEFNGAKDYSRNFFAFNHDFNNDGWTDILIVGFPGQETAWYENPKGQQKLWDRHVAHGVTDNESPRWGDLTGDGKPELICMAHGLIGWAEPNWNDPEAEWTFHKASHKPEQRFHKFTHGLGYGDVNGDGKVDLLEARGWWEQPASLTGDPEWKFHPVNFSTADGKGMGGAQMYTYDVDGDGDADVITSLQAHSYGLAWFEQKKSDAGGEPTFTPHVILSDNPAQRIDGVQFSQLHALALVDMDGDGLKDIITGKRRFAHGDHGDPEPTAPPVLYWFRLTRDNGQVKYVPHQIDDASGVGTQVTVTDMNADNRPDVLVGNKAGQFVFLQQPK